MDRTRHCGKLQVTAALGWKRPGPEHSQGKSEFGELWIRFLLSRHPQTPLTGLILENCVEWCAQCNIQKLISYPWANAQGKKESISSFSVPCSSPRAQEPDCCMHTSGGHLTHAEHVILMGVLQAFLTVSCFSDFSYLFVLYLISEQLPASEWLLCSFWALVVRSYTFHSIYIFCEYCSNSFWPLWSSP